MWVRLTYVLECTEVRDWPSFCNSFPFPESPPFRDATNVAGPDVGPKAFEAFG